MPIRFKQYKNKKLARQRRNEQRNKNYNKTAYAPNHKKKWSKVEDEYVLDCSMTDFELAQMLKRSVRAIQIRRCKLKKGKPMTNDLEKQFFDTFGIEPKCKDACIVEDKYWNNEELANEYGTFDQYMNCKCGNQENCTTECSCAYKKEIYPQITDTHYLKLICLINISLIKIVKLRGANLEQLKNFILQGYLTDYEFYSNSSLPEHREQAENLKHQVQALFEEEK